VSNSTINLDHNSTTPVPAAVWDAMRLVADVGNPASAHGLGRHARQALENSREFIADKLDATPDELIFTSGATEANNLALFGLAGDLPAHILTSEIEHPCIVEPIRQLAERGFAVEYLRVGSNGIVDMEALRAQVRGETRLIALMRINHETGAIQPIVPTGPYAWHCDAAQAVGKYTLSFHDLGATTLAFSGHKFGAPPGIGGLLVKRGTRLQPQLFGGHQQRALRPGTESVVLAVGMAKALEIATVGMEEKQSHVHKLRERLVAGLASTAAIVVNGPSAPDQVSPYVVNVSFPDLRGDALVMALDLAGVACSTGSACSSGSMLKSPVLTAMRLPDDLVRGAVRFSFSADTTLEEIDSALSRITQCVARMRNS
jgi:cysteine desulfurase